MKSWRSRIATALAVGAAAITIPLTASPAQATPPPAGEGWGEPVGGETYNSWRSCMLDQTLSAPAGVKDVWCDGEGRGHYDVYYRY
ncbi:hypothetical protein [Streptomyces sp. OE57]|uniref:hypothetical protein n=1 Tax=Streptomyces lacaronensis TaxID=3379885 RepID=UPI0039B791AA